jgi:hypothetical protein
VTGQEDSIVHAKHKQKTAVHVAKLAGNTERLARLQNCPKDSKVV